MTIIESTPAKPRRLRGALYAGTLLLGGGVIGAIIVGPVLGQGPSPDGMGMHRGSSDRDGPRWGRDGDEHRGGRMMSQDDEHHDGRMMSRDDDEDRDHGWRGRGGERRFGGGERRFGEGRRFGGMMFPGAIERRVNRVLGLVDASSEQKQKVRAIFESAANDLYPIRQQRMANRKQIGEALAAATIDKAKIEQLRSDQMKLADSASKRFTDALTQAAEVLTPAQRAELGRRIDRWRRG